MEIQARVGSALDRIGRSHRPKDVIVCVFHADPIRVAVARYIGLPLDHVHRLGCDPGSVTLVNLSEKGARLMGLNQQPSRSRHKLA